MHLSLAPSHPTLSFRAPNARPAYSSDVPPAQFASLHAGDLAPRPTRIGVAPLTGVLAVDAYRLTAAASGPGVLARIDEYV